jgi:hypothetical protein
LTDEEISFIARETNIDPAKIEALKRSAQMAAATSVPSEVFYGLASQGLSLDLNALLAKDRADLRNSLEAAIHLRIIPARWSDSLDRWMEALVRLRADTTPLAHLAAEVGLEVPEGLLAFLEDCGISTLGEVRRSGGVANLEGLPISARDPVVTALDAHARLRVLSPDPHVNAKLIEHGFTNALEIATLPAELFVATLAKDLGEGEATKIHAQAAAQASVLNNYLTGMMASAITGQIMTVEENRAINKIHTVMPPSCHCEDCENALSPLAYLADLLVYATKNLQNNGQLITHQWLTSTFHQPFTDLPASCKEMNEQIPQVRLCIEVLRRYLAVNNLPAANSPKATVLTQAQKKYRIQAYEALLTRLSASYADVRTARTADQADRVSLADRIGIALADPRPLTGDELDRLLLDPNAQAPSALLLTEQMLEALFGLADTTRDPLSRGAKLGDTSDQIKRWRIDGVKWGINTDLDGKVFVSLKPAGSARFDVEIYRDRARTKLEASGQGLRSDGAVQLYPSSVDDLSGSLKVGFIAASSDIEIAVVPAVLSWRRRRLRSLWAAQDFPTDSYIQGALPIVDPDLIGADDLRNPAAGDTAFDLWLIRREWVDDTLASLRGITQTVGGVAVPNLTQMLNSMAQVTYGGSTDPFWTTNFTSDLNTVVALLAQGATNQAAQQTLEQFWNDYRMELEAATRIKAIIDKDDAWQNSPAGQPPVSAEEWEEVYSILVQTQKNFLYPAWQQEEGSAALIFSPESFWISLNEPAIGTWPLPEWTVDPLVDPDLVKLADLPDLTLGDDAQTLWKNRRTTLVQAIQTLAAEDRTEQGLQSMVDQAVGAQTSLSDLEDLEQRLNDTDPSISSKPRPTWRASLR